MTSLGEWRRLTALSTEYSRERRAGRNEEEQRRRDRNQALLVIGCFVAFIVLAAVGVMR